jgi:hypothetical protein
MLATPQAAQHAWQHAAAAQAQQSSQWEGSTAREGMQSMPRTHCLSAVSIVKHYLLAVVSDALEAW